MNNSEQLNEIFKALSSFQGDLENASKNVDKQGISWKYADLAGCINTAKPHLVKHGLAVTQFMGMYDGKQSLTTMLTHSSGQYISDEVQLPDAVLHGSSGKNPVQVLGSAITYVRRYNYAAIIGMAQEDDDGVSANNAKSPSKVIEVPVKWYQDALFEQEKQDITKAIRDGMPPDAVIKSIQAKGFTINNKIKDLIKAI
tara:strand:+ start:607 stop:1203 length:597 start_codon:yes stop_codon:yes gene_type:complete